MTFNDFCVCTPSEFEHVYKAWREMRDCDYKDSWERTRMLATIVIQPHIKKKLTPGKLLPFTWDKKRTAAKDEALSYNERMERAEKARRKFENL